MRVCVGRRWLSYHASKKRARKLISEDDLKEQMAMAQERSKMATNSKVFVNSLDRVADDYVPPGGLSGMAGRAQNELANRAAQLKIKSDLKDFTMRGLVAEATALYEQYQRAFAARDLAALRPLLAPAMTTQVKAALAGLPAERPGVRTEWEGRVQRATLLTLRMIPVDELALNFAQATVRFETVQRLREREAATGAAGRETAEREVQVRAVGGGEVWVCLLTPAGRTRGCWSG